MIESFQKDHPRFGAVEEMAAIYRADPIQYLQQKYALIIVDELGYIPFSPEGAQLLFQVFAQRYERGSLLVTSNLAFAQWLPLRPLTGLER